MQCISVNFCAKNDFFDSLRHIHRFAGGCVIFSAAVSGAIGKCIARFMNQSRFLRKNTGSIFKEVNP